MLRADCYAIWWLQRGKQFAETSTRARQTIAELGAGFVHHDAVVLVHGFSRVVLALLHQVANNVSTQHLAIAVATLVVAIAAVVAPVPVAAVVVCVFAHSMQILHCLHQLHLHSLKG